MTDFLDVKRREISDRLKEIKPLVEEYSRLEAAASALAGVGGSAPAAAAARRKKGPGRPRGSVNRASARCFASLRPLRGDFRGARCSAGGMTAPKE